MREYLVKIYRLADQKPDKPYVGTSELADEMMVSAPAVNRMITKLRELGLLHHERYQGIALTNDGEREALKQLRRHRIVESFLVDVMGFGWHEVAQDAEHMSSQLGERLLARMNEMAGNPTHDPHGDPIPSPDGSLPELSDDPLTQVAPENDYRVTRITTHEADRLEYLAALGLTPGQTFTLLHAAPFNGPLQLQLQQQYRIIGYNLAELIRVKRAH